MRKKKKKKKLHKPLSVTVCSMSALGSSCICQSVSTRKWKGERHIHLLVSDNVFSCLSQKGEAWKVSAAVSAAGARTHARGPTPLASHCSCANLFVDWTESWILNTDWWLLFHFYERLTRGGIYLVKPCYLADSSSVVLEEVPICENQRCKKVSQLQFKLYLKIKNKIKKKPWHFCCSRKCLRMVGTFLRSDINTTGPMNLSVNLSALSPSQKIRLPIGLSASYTALCRQVKDC